MLGPEESGKADLVVVGAIPGVPVMPLEGAVRGGWRGLSAVCHRGIPRGREGLQPVLPTLGAVALIVQPRMIATMPLPPPKRNCCHHCCCPRAHGRDRSRRRHTRRLRRHPWVSEMHRKKKAKDKARQNGGGGGTNKSRGIE